MTASDYYPFGMNIASRSVVPSDNYRYGFNGQEKDGEFHDNNEYGLRIYDSRLGRWLSPDPLKQFVFSQYQAFANNPIRNIDIKGGWIPGVDDQGNIILTAEEGDNNNTLRDFFGSTAAQYKYFGYTPYTYKAGQTIILKESVYSLAMKHYLNNKGDYESTEHNYNCVESVLKSTQDKEPDYNEYSIKKGGDANLGSDHEYLKYKKNYVQEKKNQGNRIFGESFIEVVRVPWIGNEDIFLHTMVYFGKSKNGIEYVFTKSGKSRGPLITRVSQTFEAYSSQRITSTKLNYYNKKTSLNSGRKTSVNTGKIGVKTGDK